MTLTNSVAAKLSVAFVAIAMAFALVAPAAQAQTTEELQAQIAELMATIAALQAQVGMSGGVDGGVSACVTIPAPLTIGAQGADVTNLQNFLIAEGQSIPAGATGYFGSQTQAALAGWQAANGVSPAVGYYGPITKAAMDAKCATMDDGDDMDDEDEDEDDEDMDLSGEASLDKFEMDDPSDDEIEEGEEDAVIGEVTVEFTDGDAEISRMDLQILGNGDSVVTSSAEEPWEAFESFSIWVDGDKVAEVDADDEDEYLDEDAGTIRISNLGIIAEEDDELEILIGATLQDNLDADELTAWDLRVNEMRFFDADGVATTEDGTGDLGTAGASDAGVTADFTIEEAGGEDELIVRTSSSDPSSATLQLEDDSDSDWYTVFVFDLDTDDSVNDIELDSVPVTVTLSSSTYAAIVDDAELVIDGTTIDDVAVTGSGPYVLTFDVDGDVTIDAGDRVEAELMLKFNSLDTGNEGMTVTGSVTGANANAISAEGADDLDNTSPDQLRGAAEGDAHTLRTTGVDVSVEETDADITVVDGADNDYGTFSIDLEVTAFEQDVFIPLGSASTTWKLVDGGGSDLVTSDTASTTVVVSSSADEGGAGDAFFEINEGQTETVTVTVTYTPGGVAPQSARLQLLTFVFDETGTVSGADDSTWTALPASDYRTDTITIQD
jgi:hypothetical protein